MYTALLGGFASFNLLPVPSRFGLNFCNNAQFVPVERIEEAIVVPMLHPVRSEISKVHLQSVSRVSFRRACKILYEFHVAVYGFSLE